MRICYLSSDVTVAGALNRRSDAFEHDRMIDCLRAAFAVHGGVVDDISWRDKGASWKQYDAVMIGTAWDYQDNLNAFLSTLKAIASQTRLFNSPGVVKWNSKKTYLRDLAEKGVRTIPTLWFDRVSEDDARAAFDALDTDDLVFKRQIGASAEGQHRVRKGAAIPAMPEAMMAQPFLKTIQSEGEISFIFIGGAFSHAVQKRPSEGDYRIQAIYGGEEAAYEPSQPDLAAAACVIEAVEAPLLYGRVDMLRDEDGLLSLMELELVEPFLYPQQGPELGPRIYAALQKAIAA